MTLPTDGSLLYHWSPRRNRASIQRFGLSPGQPANDGGWNPPHVCLATSPTLALALCHGQPPLDLWLVHPDDCEDLVAVDREWRTRSPVPAMRVNVAAHEGEVLTS